MSFPRPCTVLHADNAVLRKTKKVALVSLLSMAVLASLIECVVNKVVPSICQNESIGLMN